MGYLSGQHGQLQVRQASGSGFLTIGSIKSWSVNFAMEVLDTSSLGDKDRTLHHGLRSFTGACTVMYYEEQTSNFKTLTDGLIETGDDGYTAQDFGAKAAEPQLMRMLLRAKGGSNRDIELFAYINSFNITCSVGEILSAEATFEGHGAPVAFGY